jgi:hypothetical protein
MYAITIDLKLAGLTHAAGKSDKCGSDGHNIDMDHVTDWNSSLIEPSSLTPILQLLHEQAHPRGTQYWHNCRESGCTEAYELTTSDR